MQDDIPAQSNNAREEESGSTRCREYAVIVWGEKVLIISDTCSDKWDSRCWILCPLPLLLASQDIIYEHCRRGELGGAHQHSEGDLRLVDTWLWLCRWCLFRFRYIVVISWFCAQKMSFFNQPSIIISEDIPLSVLHRALVLQVACIADAYSMLLHCWVLTASSKIGMPWGHIILVLGPSLYMFAHVGDGNGLCDGWGFHVLCRCSNDLLATFWSFFPWWYFVVDADLHWKGSLSCMCHPSNFHRSRLDYRPDGGITFFCVGGKGLKKWSVPRLGLRFGSLRPTFMIYDYSVNRNIAIFEHCISRALTESWERIGNIWQVTWGISYKVWGKSCMLLDEDDTT